ncbi:MAG: hypothetical protein U0M21_06545 [Emergencia sp.]|nr:hypothetical protein [Emergencia sp.]
MEYFFSHIGYILIAGLAIAAVCIVWILVAEKNNRERDINDERCDFTCSSCPNTEVCHKAGKKL